MLQKLLMKDLCARLQYGVKGKVCAEVSYGKYDMWGEMIFYDAPFDVILDGINVSTEEIHVVAIGNEDTIEFIEMQQTDGAPYTIDEFKPYLRPMSSMTKEEKRELQSFYPGCFGNQWLDTEKGTIDIFECSSTITLYLNDSERIVDWLNKKMFDYRGLIPKGLAIEVTEENNPYK